MYAFWSCTFAYYLPRQICFLDHVHLQLPGPSMLPTINHGNIALAERITSRLGKVGSGDVVVLRSPEDPRKVVTKRVKGVEGDVVSYLSDPNKSDEQKTVVVIVRKLLFDFLVIKKIRSWFRHMHLKWCIFPEFKVGWVGFVFFYFFSVGSIQEIIFFPSFSVEWVLGVWGICLCKQCVIDSHVIFLQQSI